MREWLTTTHKMDWMCGRSAASSFSSTRLSLVCEKATVVLHALKWSKPMERLHRNNANISLIRPVCVFDWRIQCIRFSSGIECRSRYQSMPPIKPKTQSLNQFVFRAERFNHNHLQLISFLGTRSFLEYWRLNRFICFSNRFLKSQNKYLYSVYTFQHINILFCFVILEHFEWNGR